MPWESQGKVGSEECSVRLGVEVDVKANNGRWYR